MRELKKKMTKESAQPQELSEDIEVIGPGQMLKEGRKAMSMSQEDVAKSLNFRLTLVRDLEEEKFDKSLPTTFNRGYLRNFAKLVNISVDDVLAAYEMLDVAEKQGAEMQSFSKITKRQAENSRLKWLTYLIVAIIFGSTLFWFFQDASPHIGANDEATTINTAQVTVQTATKASEQELLQQEQSPKENLPSDTERHWTRINPIITTLACNSSTIFW